MNKNELRVERVKQIMKTLGLTQVKMSEQIGIQQSHISRYLTGSLEISDGFCYQIICQYGINPRWMEYGEGRMFLTNEYPTSEEGSVPEMREELAIYRKTLNNLNDIVERQNRRMDELELQVKNKQGVAVNSDVVK